MNIAVYCSSSEKLDEKYYELARNFGNLMANRGHNLIYGGTNKGIMGEVAKQLAGKGKLIGVVPEIFNHADMTFNGCDEVIHTETMSQRKAKMEELADAFVILPGGIGTFDELFEAYSLKSLGLLDKPIAILNAYHLYNHLEALLETITEENFMTEDKKTIVSFFADSNELLAYLEKTAN